MIGLVLHLVLGLPPQAPPVSPLPPQAPPIAQPPIVWGTSYESARDLALRGKVPLLIRFTASWCVPCRTMAATLKEPAVENAIRAGRFVVVVVNVDARPDLATKYRVWPDDRTRKGERRGIPLLLREDLSLGLYRRLVGGSWDAETIVRDMLR